MSLSADDMLKFKADFEQIQSLLDRLFKEARLTLVFLVDKDGRLVAASGDPDSSAPKAIDLGAGRRGRDTEELTQIQIVGRRLILVTIYHPSRARIALVRRCVGEACDELSRILDALDRKVQEAGLSPQFPEVTDQDINHLFGA